MDRLTRKSNGKDYCIYCRYIEQTNELFGRNEELVTPDEYYKEEPYQVVEGYYNEDILVKLGKLEDLEEELGCPLEVVFKALNEGIYIAIEKIDFFLRPRLYFSDDYKNWCFELAFGGYVVHLKDHQKTWWLKGEKGNE